MGINNNKKNYDPSRNENKSELNDDDDNDEIQSISSVAEMINNDKLSVKL